MVYFGAFLPFHTQCLFFLRVELVKMDVDTKESSFTDNYCSSTTDLQKHLKESVDKILKNVSEEKFVQIYKDCYKEFVKKDDIDRPSLCGSSVEAKKYRTIFNEKVKDSLSESINETVANMDDKFKDLEELKRQQSESSVIWRPPGNAAEHIIPFEYACILEKKKELEEKIQKENDTLQVLRARLQQRRKIVNDYHQRITSSIEEIRSLVADKID